jgi:hypothetical protein
MALLGRIPVPDDELVVDLPSRFDHDGRSVPPEQVRLRVETVLRRVPGVVALERLTKDER